MTMPKVSIAVIALNEVDRIEKLLVSAQFADEIIVVDSGSTDGTISLCERYGARVIHQEWLGYAQQKQKAMMATRNEWVLNMDADEVVSDELRSEIETALATTPDTVNGYRMPRLSWYLNRWIRHGGWYPDKKVRLVRKNKSRWSSDALHEKLEVEGDVETLKGDILHYVYRNISDQIQTINTFSTTVATAKGKKGTWFLIGGVFHCIGKFLECYVWKLGVLDGLPGLVIAMNSAGYVFLKHAKSWEMGLEK